MITTGLMKSEELAAVRDKARAASLADARSKLDPAFPYATLPFPDTYGATDANPSEL